MSSCIYLSILAVFLLVLLIFVYKPSEHFRRSTDYLPSLSAYRSQVQGVSFHDNNQLYLNAAMNSGMITQDAINEILPAKEDMKGEMMYREGIDIVNDSLELDPYLQDLRYKVVAAQTSYNAPEGIPANNLWRSRTYTNKLDQPGLSFKLINPAKYPYF